MRTVLLTGGRAPATLELARTFHRAGCRVLVAESLNWHLCRFSRHVRHFKVPCPRQASGPYIDALLRIVERHAVDWLIPTCEEVFYVALGRERLARHCRVFVDSLETLDALHNKWTFIQRAQRHGLPVPSTQLVDDPGALSALLVAGQDLVLKPAYSRFAAHTILLPRRPDQVARIRPSAELPWVAQAFVSGMPLCSYSVAHQGRITAHGAYRSRFRIGNGATIAFVPLQHEASFRWAQRFVAAERFTGQIAFDFIETSSGEALAIECNPRSTSGIHLFPESAALARAFFDPEQPLVTPAGGRGSMLALPMLWRGVSSARSTGGWAHWLKAFLTSRDVIFGPRDPLPALLQWIPLLQLLWRSLRRGVSPLEATTWDIEWNGPP